MTKEKSIIKIITIILLISVIFRFCFAIVHLNHDCTHDDNCPICTLIHKLKDDLNGSDPNLFKVAISILLFLCCVHIFIEEIKRNKKNNTLIGLKVMLLN